MQKPADRRRIEVAIRVLDVVLAAAAVILFSPVFALIALLIKLSSPGPVLFRQERLGCRGKPFKIYKFRTMVDGADHAGINRFAEKNDARITRLGKVFRDWSIDELPQLLNIIKGEMSIVGPRPAFIEHLKKYTPQQRLRLEVRPGLTGWAQIHGRNALSWPDRIAHDVWYVENRSLGLNLSIMLRTFPVLFKRDLIYGPKRNFYLDEETRREARVAVPNRAAPAARLMQAEECAPAARKAEASSKRSKEEIPVRASERYL